MKNVFGTLISRLDTPEASNWIEDVSAETSQTESNQKREKKKKKIENTKCIRTVGRLQKVQCKCYKSTRRRLFELENDSFSRSVMSHSSQPHRLKPSRLLCPWNSPDKNSGVGSHSLPNPGTEPRYPALQTDSLLSESPKFRPLNASSDF